MKMTKASMIKELVVEFSQKQGSDKAKWVKNKLTKMSFYDVEAQYTRLKAKVAATKKTLPKGPLKKRKTTIIGARQGSMYIQPIK